MLPNKSALDFFELIFTNDLYNLNVTEINWYATQQWKEPCNQKTPWTTLTIEEFKTWLGLYLSMGIVQQPSLMDYWTQSTLTKTPGIAAVMTRTRFLQILHYLHFIDNGSEVAKLPKDRAENNGQSTDNVRSNWGFDRSNVWLAGHFDRSKLNINSCLFIPGVFFLFLEWNFHVY